MNENDFRRIALSLPNAHEGSHMGAVDFRVNDVKFATLAHQHLGYGNLLIKPFLQRVLIAQRPDLYFPIAGGWGRMGATHVRLAESTEESLTEALFLAWQLKAERGGKGRKRR